MGYYRKKPITIEVMQYTGDNRQEIMEFTDGAALFTEFMGIKELVIHTLEGDMRAPIGAWIAKGPHGEFYPIQKDIFEETYEEVSND